MPAEKCVSLKYWSGDRDLIEHRLKGLMYLQMESPIHHLVHISNRNNLHNLISPPDPDFNPTIRLAINPH